MEIKSNQTVKDFFADVAEEMSKTKNEVVTVKISTPEVDAEYEIKITSAVCKEFL